ncbi:MAG TPA: YIP1 family protein [Dictyoglomaceae bacterium]|nr:YIP1 family protein [Dictyoglomaceae bacterium]
MGNKRIILKLVIILILLVDISFGAIPYYTYIYSERRRPIPSLPGFEPERIVTGETIELKENFLTPQDLFIDKRNGNIYVADTGNNRIVILDTDLKLKKIIKEFDNKGKKDTFKAPTGLFVTEDAKLYVADSGNGRIVILNPNGSLYQIVGKPVGDIIKEDFSYIPKKVAVDKLGRIYVVSENVVEGLIQFSASGVFERFFGSNRVEVNPVELFWRRVLTREQRSQLALFIPIEYRNVTTDKDGFIYGCVRAWSDQVKRLNALGDNIIKQEGRTGNVYGDLYFGFTVRGEIVDIALDDSDNLYILDGRVGKIFVYNTLGDFLFVFGDIGNQLGTFQYPSAIEVFNGKVYILDENKATITLFKPTSFGEMVLKANSFYVQGYYGKATEIWDRIAKMDANYDLAYIGLGKNFLHEEMYKEAMESFQLGFYPQGYSKALKGFRIEYMRENFSKIMNIFLGLIVFIYLTVKFAGRKIGEHFTGFVKKYKLLDTVLFVFYVILHPFDGFYELRRRNNAFKASLILLPFIILSFLIKRVMTGFHFNPYRPEELNVILEVGRVIIPVLAWVIINWAVTTIMDGKAKVKDIFIMTVYSLFPLALLYIPQTLLSHVLTLDEASFYYIISTIGTIWSLFVIIAGMMELQEYTLNKVLGTSLLTIGGIIFAMFIGLVFFATFQQFIKFLYTVYLEIKYMVG